MNFEITTDRLVLKVLSPSDAASVLSFYEKNGLYFSNFEPLISDDFYTLSHQEKVLSYEYKSILKLDMLRYWLFSKEDPNTIIGTISYRNIIRPIMSCCTLGYKIDPDFQRKGFCYEAIEATLPVITEDLGIHRVEALVMPNNTPSINLLKKLSFQEEGLLREKIYLNNKWEDHLMFSYIKDISN